MAFSGTCGWNSTILSCPTSSSGISFCGSLDLIRMSRTIARPLGLATSLRQIHIGRRPVCFGEDAIPPLLVRAVPVDRLAQPDIEGPAGSPAEVPLRSEERRVGKE